MTLQLHDMSLEDWRIKKEEDKKSKKIRREYLTEEEVTSDEEEEEREKELVHTYHFNLHIRHR